MPKALVYYHYLYPDDVVSAVHIFELCEELVRRGWEVKAMPSNRSLRNGAQKYIARERWRGVDIQRVWRPDFSQARALPRFANAIWMNVRWSLAALTEKPDALIIGTEPVLSIIVASAWKLLRPGTRIAHWCFDLYPEAAIADGLLRPDSGFARLLKPLLRHAYASCDLLADIGPCMARLLHPYAPKRRQVTLTPWALAEPERPVTIDPSEREALFGDSPLALMYSGSFGRAHSSDTILQLARRFFSVSPHGARIAFSVRGHREEALRRDAAGIPNVSFAPFAAQHKLEARLSAADIHIVSLQEEWTGTVVPSKFFGAIAVGRPVLFAGSEESSIAQWIRQYGVGWVLTPATIDATAGELLRYCEEPARLAALFEHCHAVYKRHFSKESVADRWDAELRGLIGVERAGTESGSRSLSRIA